MCLGAADFKEQLVVADCPRTTRDTNPSAHDSLFTSEGPQRERTWNTRHVDKAKTHFGGE